MVDRAEFATGGELFDRLVHEGAYSEHDAACLIQEVTDALAYLHGNNVVHFDIKPENILVMVIVYMEREKEQKNTKITLKTMYLVGKYRVPYVVRSTVYVLVAPSHTSQVLPSPHPLPILNQPPEAVW